ncbi:MAG: trypsin-like peptidase domain-containing protein [Planctomycetes bacterium]|nr:trypsin-like peptidase domain-containing protein [Planctomycetota bacterium]
MAMRRVTVLWWVLWACGVGVAGGVTAADPLGDLGQVERLQAALATVAEAVAPAVVAIRAERRLSPAELEFGDDSGRVPNDETHRRVRRQQVVPAIGTGIIVDADGAVLTNEHVIHGADLESITCVLSTGEVYAVRAVTSDPRSDLAILRIDGRRLPQVKLGDLSTVRQGHFAIVMGNPYGSASENRGRPAMSFGIVSALGRPLTRELSPLDERYYGNLIQTDARIRPGNSGGPMLNIHGEVIGITTAISTGSGDSDGLGYAIPIDARTKAIIAQLLRGEAVEYGFLGIRLDEPTSEDRRLAGAPSGARGALVREVEPQTPAAQAKLRAGDLVVEFDGLSVRGVDELIRLVGAARVGTPVSLTFYREGATQTVTVSPARRNVPQGVTCKAPTASQPGE